MAEEEKNKTISKINTGFPGYLNFDKLRSSAIEYLGKLSGKIWTDHNVHDPGITILEVLIYALMDLGYRTNLPVNDLFSRNPDDKTPDNNFFTPAQILGNNTLTITDYRKMLLDITGVKNAWLEIDNTTSVVFCPPVSATGQGNIDNTKDKDEEEPCKCDKINGLYHVYVQLEDETSKDKSKRKKALTKIKRALMAHRNLCEDFVDIQVLRNYKIGLCAEIELGADADIEDVYIKMAEALDEYFSPAPGFYSLQQLLDKGKSIDEIYAGRPYNTTESHGFIDTDELEQLHLKKELHLSDVYHVLFDIEGINDIRNLAWLPCGKTKGDSSWKFSLPKNHVPRFSASCSGFTFTKSRITVNFNKREFESLFNLKFSSGQKALYEVGSPYLNTTNPTGAYRNDLAEYYSIQNDFPAVYGIKEGELERDAPASRKAQALQLQGFLLFFDQLLANYLTQLKNMRSLFALYPSGNENENHTYFTNELSDTPQLQKLLRFGKGMNDENSLGSAGSIVAYPTGRKKIEDLINEIKPQNKLRFQFPNCNVPGKDFPPYQFCYATVRDQSTFQLQNDISNNLYEPVIVSNLRDEYFFYIENSSKDYVLISKDIYKTESEAASAATSIRYIAAFSNNCRKFTLSASGNEPEYFSFDIDLNLDYTKYLQLIAEDEQLYTSRRQGFLNHLLSRFAEKFTDYALLTAPFSSASHLQTQQIKAEENFLRHYPDLSSNRGKGYDYLKNRWNNDNIAGFEKRFKALAGIENWKRHYLCNFVVEEADALYYLTISLFDLTFRVKEKTVNSEEAFTSLKSIYEKLKDPVFCEKYVELENKWELYIQDAAGKKYTYLHQLFTKEEIEHAKKRLASIFDFTPDTEKDIFISKYIHKVVLTDYGDKKIGESKLDFENDGTATDYLAAIANSTSVLKNRYKQFHWLQDKKLNKLVVISKNSSSYTLIDEGLFNFKTTDVLLKNKTRKKFYSLIKTGSEQFDGIIQFESLTLYNSEEEAYKGFRKLLPLFTSENNYSVNQNKNTGKYQVFINEGEQKLSVFFDEYGEQDEANNKVKEITKELSKYTYKLSVTEPIPHKWEFSYKMQNSDGNNIDFESRGNYESLEKAKEAMIEFYRDPSSLEIKVIESELFLVLEKENQNIVCIAKTASAGLATIAMANKFLSFRKDLHKKVYDISDAVLYEMVKDNRANPDENYIYKLVDKDNNAGISVEKSGETGAEELRRKLIKHATEGYNYLEIDTGGHIIHERKDAVTKVKWYHYRVVCTNRNYRKGTHAGKPLILFESVKGYLTKNEAADSFTKNYLHILRFARFEKNYGKDKKISTEEVLVHSNDVCFKPKSIVFIPKKTMEEYNGYEVHKELIPLAASYPVRIINIRRKDDESRKPKWKYFFYVGKVDDNLKTYTKDWISGKLYNNAKETMQHLQFFLTLLKYPGNFFIEKKPSDCQFYVHVKEVLAMSAQGFKAPEDAWGEKGIEKFICVSQSENSFQGYLNPDKCADSFFVACGNTGLVHPCVYETARRRDEAMQQLCQAAQKFSFFDLIHKEIDGIIKLYDVDTLHNIPKPKELAILNLDEKIFSTCKWLSILSELVYDDACYPENEPIPKLLYTNKKSGKKILLAEAVEEKDMNKWKIQMRKTLFYFPLIKKDDQCGTQSGKKKYYIEIKFPALQKGENESPDSGKCREMIVDNNTGDCKPSCHVAWKSDCCFDDCCKALDFYLQSVFLLRTHEHYKPINDCDCMSYRIGIYPPLSLKDKNEFLHKYKTFASETNWVCKTNKEDGTNTNENNVPNNETLVCTSEIIAINPQQYPNNLMACEAIDRAKKLINSEGLHLVEHILLRPHCPETDLSGNRKYTDCEGQPTTHLANEICHFKWESRDKEDPCPDNEAACFTPGCDPYSFIATVALPAWPQRFRSKESRQIVEKLLQREAPAHVLLRILWLRPRDFCCFEYYFKLWTHWLGKKLCKDFEYQHSEFLHLLFKKDFDDTKEYECKECSPCSCANEKESCFEDEDEKCKDVTVLKNVNQLFGWSNKTDFDYEKCEPCKKDKADTTKAELPANELKADTASGVIKIPDEKGQQKPLEDTSISEPRVLTINWDKKDKTNLMRKRATSYKENIKTIADRNKESVVAGNASIFLTRAPSLTEFGQLTDRILNDKTDKKSMHKGLSKEDKKVLLQNIAWNYMDQVCFDDKKEIEKIAGLKKTFELIKSKAINISSWYSEWKSVSFSAFEPGIDFKKIERLFK